MIKYVCITYLFEGRLTKSNKILLKTLDECYETKEFEPRSSMTRTKSAILANRCSVIQYIMLNR